MVRFIVSFVLVHVVHFRPYSGALLKNLVYQFNLLCNHELILLMIPGINIIVAIYYAVKGHKGVSAPMVPIDILRN